MMLVDVVSHKIEPAQMCKQNSAAAPKPSFLISLHGSDRKQVDHTALERSAIQLTHAVQ